MRFLANTAKMSKEEWLSFRPLGVGGSEAATTLDKNPYQTKFGLYLEKRGEIKPFEGNERTKWGTRMEAVIVEEFKERNPNIWVQRKNFILQHDKHDFMIGNIDRDLFCKERGRGILEVKNHGFFGGKAWQNEAGAPIQYILQMQHYFGITGYEWGRYAYLVDGGEYHEIEMLPDPIIIEILIEAEAKFMECVRKGIEPEIGGTDAEAEILKRLYPEATKAEAVPLEAKAAELIKKRQAMKEKLKQEAEELAAIENNLKHMLGEHEAGFIDNVYVNYKNIVSNRVDSNKLKAEFPDVAAQVMKAISSRRFEIKEAK